MLFVLNDFLTEYRKAYVALCPPQADVLQSQIAKYMEEYDERVEKVTRLVNLYSEK
jgi:hypothetical protein